MRYNGHQCPPIPGQGVRERRVTSLVAPDRWRLVTAISAFVVIKCPGVSRVGRLIRSTITLKGVGRGWSDVFLRYTTSVLIFCGSYMAGFGKASKSIRRERGRRSARSPEAGTSRGDLIPPFPIQNSSDLLPDRAVSNAVTQAAGGGA
ncbi:hypothetical protein EVAR_81057_1 [Eumeta japonica]|uniref:Uncharacterized protein n=1 Tax=Eumeta variegata TaxID=151549 RepID=A0A4C1T5U5_EUMVA|nr:hypothetical protein EVAR_81057_1 [Eumeta japonica]